MATLKITSCHFQNVKPNNIRSWYSITTIIMFYFCKTLLFHDWSWNNPVTDPVTDIISSMMSNWWFSTTVWVWSLNIRLILIPMQNTQHGHIIIKDLQFWCFLLFFCTNMFCREKREQKTNHTHELPLCWQTGLGHLGIWTFASSEKVTYWLHY